MNDRIHELLHRNIQEIFGEGEGLGIRVRYVVEPMPLGTGGAIRYAGDSLTESVVVLPREATKIAFRLRGRGGEPALGSRGSGSPRRPRPASRRR